MSCTNTQTEYITMKKTLITLLALAGIAMGETLTLTIPTGNQNSTTKKDVDDDGDKEIDREDVVFIVASGSTNVAAAITAFADDGKDGGYMFNNGGAVESEVANNEGFITSDPEKGICLTLYGRTGAGGSGEAIVLSGTELVGSSVESFTFSIAGSTCDQADKAIGMTLAVVQKEGNTWTKVGNAATGSFLTGSGSSITLTLDEAINWSDAYKVVAIVDNQAKNVTGGTTAYSMNGISVSATYSIPEPATATLSLLALAGLAARRRRH